jgi:hypothetical protein
MPDKQTAQIEQKGIKSAGLSQQFPGDVVDLRLIAIYLSISKVEGNQSIYNHAVKMGIGQVMYTRFCLFDKVLQPNRRFFLRRIVADKV